MKTISIRTKLLGSFLMIVLLSLLTLYVEHFFHARILAFSRNQDRALDLKSKVESLLYEIHELSSGLFMMAADEGGYGRSVILEARLAMAELTESLNKANWENHSLSREDLRPCLELADQLMAEAHRTLLIVAELKDVETAEFEDPRNLAATLHRSLARTKMLAAHAEVHATRITEILHRDARENAERGASLASSSRISTLIMEIMVIVLALALGINLARSFARRLTALEHAAHDYGRGDFSRRADVSAQDELGALALSFNHMAEELQTKTKLLLSKAYVENILNTMTNCLFVVNADRTIEQINRATCELLGRGARELVGTELDALFWPPGDVGCDSVLMREIMSGTAEKMELTLCGPDGGHVPVSLSSALMATDGSLPRVVCVAEDITERKELIQSLLEAKRAAERADRAKSAFLANMSHELRTPLNGILGYAQILLRDKSLTEYHRDALATMHRSGEHLLTLLNDILDLSKIEAGRMELQQTDFHLPTFIKDIADMFRVRATQKGIQFLCEMVSEVPRTVRGDERRLRQILINLLGNAIKFTAEGGVVLKVGMHHGKVRFQVEDTGIGIAKEHLGEIFAPFKQVVPNPDKIEGTGLGLAITRRLAIMMGSTLMVESEPGRGSVFWLDLELPEVDGAHEPRSEETPVIVGYEGRRLGVLIADDKDENRAVLVSLLGPLGFEIIEAVDGRDALDKAGSSPPDIILMDLRMPVMDGLEATRRIMSLPGLGHTKIIAISASAFDENREQSEAAGCHAFLTKPIRLTLLLETMQSLLGLTWVYESARSSSESSGPLSSRPPGQPDAEPLAVPPRAELALLYDLALRGDIGGIRERITHIEAASPAHGRFVAELRALAKAYQIKQIRELLTRHMDKA